MLKLIPPTPGRSSYYRIRGTDKATGRRIDTTTGFTTKREAEAVLQRLQRDILNGVLGRPSRGFTEAAVEYVESRQPTGTQSAAIIGHVRRSDGEISPCLVIDFGDRDCRSIDQAAVNEIVRRRFQRNRHGKPYKPGTVVRELIQPLTAVLNYAAQQGWCDPPNFVRPKFDDRRREFATPEECTRLLRAAAPHARRWYLFMILAGSRVSETLDLDWSDVWLARNWAVLRDTKHDNDDRGIALHPQIVEMLSKVPEAERFGKVFTTNGGGPYAETPDGGGRGKKGWLAALRRSGVTKPLRLHDLRHTFGTLSLLAGMSKRMQEQQMGHGKNDMNARYVHVPDPDLITGVAKLPRLDYRDITYAEWRADRFGSVLPPKLRKDAKPARAA